MTLRYTFRCSFDDLASLTQGLSGIEAQEILRGCWQLIKVEPQLKQLYVSYLILPSHILYFNFHILLSL